MVVEDKLETLVTSAQFDVCSYDITRPGSNSPLRFIHRAALPNGGSIPLFKVLLTNVCINDCAYCVNQIGRDCPRHSFQPHELAKLFMELYIRKLVRGLFLSSGIGLNASQTMESMIKAVEILRYRFEYKGYIHLKILPEASFDSVAEGCKLASRVSINMEAPTPEHMAKLSSKKDLNHGIVERMRWVQQLLAKNERLVPSGQTTQFVVGAAGETDQDILYTTEALYHEIDLRRVYFSAFRPVKGSRLEWLHPASPLRQHRLYQADWLIRTYGFSHQELGLALDKGGNLRLNRDPKFVIAQKQPWLFPVDVNRASYDELLRVPGIGPLSAKRIIDSRKEHSIFSLQQLKKMGVSTKRAIPYIWFKGILNWEKQSSFIPQLEDLDEHVPSLTGILG